jgi:choline dehydrogenase-like flavoprotein
MRRSQKANSSVADGSYEDGWAGLRCDFPLGFFPHMFIDSTTLADNTTIKADVCIIGAGAAGITLARDLAGGKRRIAVFESGGFEFKQDTQRLYEGTVVGQSFIPLDADRLRYLGGSTNHWSGSCRPFDAGDLEGWPFDGTVLESYYRRAQEILQLGPYSYEPREWVTEEAPLIDLGAAGLFHTGMFQNSPPTRFGAVYRQDLQTADNVSVYLQANLVNIETNDNASEVSGIVLACLDGRRFRAHARHYVLATGGIENARLLLNSDHVQKGGLGNGFDLVGRYFMDHAYVDDVATILFTDPHPKLEFYTLHTVRGQRVQGYLTPTPELRRKEGWPPFSLGINLGNPPSAEFAKQSLLTVYRSLMSGQIPDHFGMHVANILAGVEMHAIQMYYSLMHSEPDYYTTSFVIGPAPDPESRVTLIDTVDAIGLRRVKLDWRLPANFDQIMQRSHEILAQELGRSGTGRLRINAAVSGPEARKNAFNSHHHMGTTRMHADARQGVVDANCRVHGIANLFIAGSSVFPTYSFDDPTMTIVALALRLSDYLKSSLA